MDLHFNLDWNIQRVQLEGDIEGLGSVSVIVDFKEVKALLEVGIKHGIKEILF